MALKNTLQDGGKCGHVISRRNALGRSPDRGSTGLLQRLAQLEGRSNRREEASLDQSRPKVMVCSAQMDIRNMLHFGDNLKTPREHVVDAGFDLVYLGLLINSSENYHIMFNEDACGESRMKGRRRADGCSGPLTPAPAS
jgi:hypothetical protein